jgi:anti-anti-sigma factor
MDDHLIIARASAGGVVTLSLSGELDPSTAPTLDDAVGAALASEGVDQVLLDLAAVSFIDSSGLSALLTAHTSGEATGITVAVTNPSAHCQRLLTLSNLTHLLA